MNIATLHRRHWLRAAGSALALAWHPVQADEAADALRAAVRTWAGGQLVGEGRITLDIAPLVENGNAVPVSVRVDSPMTPANHVRELVLLNERNPQRDVLRVAFTPLSARAQVDTRIRLATTQQLVALARLSDGSLWSRHVQVMVTLAACVEG